MRTPFVNSVGGVVSADIAVPEHGQELDFYSSILTTGATPLWRNDLMNNLGIPIIGLGVRTREYSKLPLQWHPHFQVADVAASVENAIAMGGKEIMHGKDEKGESLWAGLVDPTGAAFGVIPVSPCQVDAEQRMEPFGRISWLSLTVLDALASRDFYQRVVGWRGRSIETSEEDVLGFEMLIDNETIAAEICQQSNERNRIPSVWMIHLPVGDLNESLARLEENGGEVVAGTVESRCVVIRDPVGVYLALQAEQ